MENLATEKQINLIKKLQAEKKVIFIEDFNGLDKRTASATIGKLLYKTSGNDKAQAHKHTNANASDALIIPQDLDILNAYINSQDASDRDYAKKTTSAVIKLSTGTLYAIEKRAIETSFCFGYGFCGVSSMEESDRANDLASNARTNEDYFINENLKYYDEKIKSILAGFNVWHTCDYNEAQAMAENRPIVALKWGSSCRSVSVILKSDYENNRNYYRGAIVEDLTMEDRDNLVKLYKSEKEKMRKRLNTYLKKYGLSKIRSWSFLVD